MPKIYVTYDLEESGAAEPKEIYRGAHELPVEAERVISWEVGELKRAWGRDVYGVRVRYVRPGPRIVARSEAMGEALSEEIVEVPSNAENVQVHLGSVPKEYRNGLLSAA